MPSRRDVVNSRAICWDRDATWLLSGFETNRPCPVAAIADSSETLIVFPRPITWTWSCGNARSFSSRPASDTGAVPAHEKVPPAGADEVPQGVEIGVPRLVREIGDREERRRCRSGRRRPRYGSPDEHARSGDGHQTGRSSPDAAGSLAPHAHGRRRMLRLERARDRLEGLHHLRRVSRPLHRVVLEHPLDQRDQLGLVLDDEPVPHGVSARE